MKELEDLRKAVSAWEAEDRAKVEAAVEAASIAHEGQVRASGEPAVTHPLRVALILAELGLDSDAVVAAVLHHAPDEDGPARKDLAERFGPTAALLVEETSRIAALKAKNKTLQAAETIRKMLLAMTRDIRVILVKLADKLDNMRTLRWLPEEERKRIAAECLDIFAPLADRLGLSAVKDELEDLALKELNREAFDQIKAIVADRKGERAEFLARVEQDIRTAAAQEKLFVEVSSRAKHFYSIYQKMRKRNKSADELYDLLGIRLLCGTENDCYALLGVVHRLWKPLEGRFKDYIAMPKANGYRSLHTTVMAYEGRLLEIQIRTYDMHRVAEFGVASHWLYKKGRSRDTVRTEDLPLVNKLKDWSGMLSSGAEFLQEIKRELLKESIFVFTPKGDVVELPAGSTPLDFAYEVHTAVGNRCVGAKADGAIVPLTYELKNTQVVEIMTSNSARPNIDWLRAVKTSKAKSKIRQWLITNGQALVIDRNVVARKKADAPEAKGEARPRGEGRPEPGKAGEPAPEVRPAVPEPDRPLGQIEIHPYVPRAVLSSDKAGISVSGGRGLMIRFAGCCRPTTGDPIVGYVSRGRGIIVHRRDCRNLPFLSDFKERAIEVVWETRHPGLTRRFRITAKRIPDLFGEVETAVKKIQGHLIEGKLEEDGDRLVGWFTVRMERPEDGRKIERSVRGVPAILKVQVVDSER
mgnify:FL=1